ncbi:hypothetical protein KEM52_000953 [Ascosphaera acerosa]|nr:hypothetical protein KEM52_000953 [Ascosphaera acerosa]
MSLNAPHRHGALPAVPPGKPWLNAQRRKLRHLQGLSLRNLAPGHGRRQHDGDSDSSNASGRRKPIDDDNAPNALQTVAKERARHDAETLHLSRSVGNLNHLRQAKANAASPARVPSRALTVLGRSEGAGDRDSPVGAGSGSGQASNEGILEGEGTTAQSAQARHQRPIPRRPRKSSALWNTANQQTRQSYLEELAEERLADSWFSLHCATIDDPLYISEVVGPAVNPDFRFFDLKDCGPLASRLATVTVKVWVKPTASTNYTLLKEQHVDLRDLRYLGRSLDEFQHPLPSNCIIFHFEEGVYAQGEHTPACLPIEASRSSDATVQTTAAVAAKPQPTSSYDALMRLTNLDDCIQDAIAVREQIEEQMNALLQRHRASEELMSEGALARQCLPGIRQAIATTRSQIRAATKRRDDLKHRAEIRRRYMQQGPNAQAAVNASVEQARTAIELTKSRTADIGRESTDQIRRISEDLSLIYPIEPISGRPLSFTICGIYLPDSNFEGRNKDELAAALGYAAHILSLISTYIGIPLPYPINARLSRSTIDDPLSMKLVDRTFPLFLAGPYYRFDYAVFLLNKDIDYLMARLGLRIIDVRQTLPNMKYLLYILTAGTRELPSRKAGGVIRGLLGSGRLSSSPVSDRSRRDSQDSASFSVSGSSVRNEAVSRRMRDQLASEGITAKSPGREASGSDDRNALNPRTSTCTCNSASSILPSIDATGLREQAHVNSTASPQRQSSANLRFVALCGDVPESGSPSLELSLVPLTKLQATEAGKRHGLSRLTVTGTRGHQHGHRTGLQLYRASFLQGATSPPILVWAGGHKQSQCELFASSQAGDAHLTPPAPGLPLSMGSETAVATGVTRAMSPLLATAEPEPTLDRDHATPQHSVRHSRSPPPLTLPPSQQHQQQPPQPQQQQQQHRRGYQACDACRKRKVKCDQGSVDNPRPPPCTRCRREQKRCEFSAVRRKRKNAEIYDNDNILRRDERMMYGDPTASPPPSVSSVDRSHNALLQPHVAAWSATASVLANGVNGSGSTVAQGAGASSTALSTPLLADAPSRSDSVYRPVRRSDGSFSSTSGEAKTAKSQEIGHVINKAAAALVGEQVANSHDVLNQVAEAVERSEHHNRHRYSSARRHSSSFKPSGSPHHASATPQRPVAGRGATAASSRPFRPAGWYGQEGEIDHGHAQDSGQEIPIDGPEEVENMRAVQVWSRLRFIRAGWFTVDEAMKYVAYFYHHLAPLSPIVLPDFNSPSTHHKLLTEEPILAVTMLTIASRHMELDGSGAHTRAYQIHEMLWSYLRRMIERLIWGQEKFGDSNLVRRPMRHASAQSSKRRSVKRAGPLRSLGTVEALLLLTDWHPRSLYFPPSDDENALLDADPELMLDRDQSANRSASLSSEGRFAFPEWLEPVWRADRMSWMLLSTAQSLAFELGVFDLKNDLTKSSDPPDEQRRKRRVRRLILVYTSQCSGRLGIPSMLPIPEWELDSEPPPTATGSAFESASLSDAAVDQMQECWLDISKINYASNVELFSSKEYTTQFVRTGRYREKIDEYMPRLHKFKQKIETLPCLEPQMRVALLMEYQYTRLYINCMALSKWTTAALQETRTAANGTKQPLNHNLIEEYRVDEAYIQEVVAASRAILEIVLDKLAPNDLLKHSPIRTFYRILSGMLFILKVWSCSAKEDDVRRSLELQDRTIECLRTYVVDDVHLSVTIASLVESLTSSIRTKFVRWAPPGSDANDGTAESNSMTQSEDPAQTRAGTAAQSQATAADEADCRTRSLKSEPDQQAMQSTGETHGQMFPSHSGLEGTAEYDVLAGIPRYPFDSSAIDNSFIPPSAMNYYDQYYNATNTMPISTAQPGTASVPPHQPLGTAMYETDHGLADEPNAPSVAQSEIAGPASSTAQQHQQHPPQPGPSDWVSLDPFNHSSSVAVDHVLSGTGDTAFAWPLQGEYWAG